MNEWYEGGYVYTAYFGRRNSGKIYAAKRMRKALLKRLSMLVFSPLRKAHDGEISLLIFRLGELELWINHLEGKSTGCR